MSAIAILSIGLSVGATAVVFAAIRSVLLTPLPNSRPSELVQIRTDYSYATSHACTIIGVMPPGFDFPLRLATPVRTPSQHMDFWATLACYLPARRACPHSGRISFSLSRLI